MVRENYGDRGGIEVKERNFRTSHMPVDVTDIPSDDLGDENIERDNVVVDAKRKRMEDTMKKVQGENQDNLNAENQHNEPLNLYVAGPGNQARIGL